MSDEIQIGSLVRLSTEYLVSYPGDYIVGYVVDIVVDMIAGNAVLKNGLNLKFRNSTPQIYKTVWLNYLELAPLGDCFVLHCKELCTEDYS